MTATTTTAPARTRRSPATTTSARPTSTAGQHGQAARHAVEANTTQLDFHLGDAEIRLTLPPLDKMAFYVGLTGAAVLGVIEWPIALVTGIGHLLSDDRHNRTLRALGEALDAV